MMLLIFFFIFSVTLSFGDDVIDTTTTLETDNTTETIEVDTNIVNDTFIPDDLTVDYNITTNNTKEGEICYDETTTEEEVTATVTVENQEDASDSLWYADYDIEEYTDDDFESKNINNFILDKGYVGGTIPLLNRKVHRGSRASVYEFPFVVSIRRNLAHYQIGILITTNLVFTVAHGVYNVPIYDLTLVHGENYSDRGIDPVPIILYIVHPDFNPYTLEGDLAILRTNCDMILRGNLKEIMLLRNDIIIMGAEATLVGWGRCDHTGKEVCLPRSTEFFPNEISDPMLRSVKIHITGAKFCDVYTKVMNLTLYPGMFCAGPSRIENPTTPCMAVPGAPLVVYSFLVGLQSWGYGCGYHQDLPIVYTDLRYYSSWLKHELEILDNVTNKDLNDILIGSQSYVMSRTLRHLRGMEPLTNRGYDRLELYELDQKISQLFGTVYDYRDFIFDGIYSKQKQDAYVSWKMKRHKMKLMHMNQSITDCPMPFIRKEDRHYLYQDDEVVNSGDDVNEEYLEEQV